MGTALVPPPSAFLRSPTCPWQVALQQSPLPFRPARQIWPPGNPHVRPNAVLYEPTHLKRGSLQTLTPGPSPGERGASVRPNPSTGAFVLSYPVQGTAGQLEVLDAAGRVVHTAYLAPWSQLHHLELHQPPGLYHCRLRWNGRVLSTRIMIVEP